MKRFYHILRLAIIGVGGAVVGRQLTEHKQEAEQVRSALGGGVTRSADTLDLDLRTPVDVVLHPRWIIPMSQNTRPPFLEKIDPADLIHPTLDSPSSSSSASSSSSSSTIVSSSSASSSSSSSTIVSSSPSSPTLAEYLVDHSIAIANGRIVGILPKAEAKKTWVGTVEESLPNGVVMPGLVNCHTHSPMNLFRSWVDGISLMEWLQEYIWPSEKRFVSPEFVELGTQLAIVEMLSSGVTTFNDMYFFPEVSARVARRMGIRAVIGLPVLEFPSNYANDAADYLAKGQALLDKQPASAELRRQQLVHFAWAPHAPYTVHDATWKQIAALAETYDVKIHTHLQETAFNVADSLNAYGLRPVERLNKLGVLSPRLIAVHLTQLVPTDIALLKDKGVAVVHCPESNLKLASGICPVGQLVRAGMRVGLGTDSSASNDDLDLLGEIRTASLLDHYVSGEAQPSLSRYQLLEMATLGGARVLGLDDEIGSLEPGKAADLISIDIHTFPVYNPLSTLSNSGGNLVTDVWVAGRRLVQNGQVLGVNLPSLYSQAQKWGQKLALAREQ